MASVTRTASTATDRADNGYAITNASNATGAVNGTVATCGPISGGDNGDTLRLLFGFVPGDFSGGTAGTLNGITVSATVRKQAGSTSTTTFNYTLVFAGTAGGSTKTGASLGTTLAADTVGSGSDVWGTTGKTLTDIINANFGVDMAAAVNIASNGATVEWDSVSMTVTYTPPPVTSDDGFFDAAFA